MLEQGRGARRRGGGASLHLSVNMAGLGSGSFGLANNVTQNKSYMHMKLTDSAFKSIEEYLRIKVSTFINS